MTVNILIPECVVASSLPAATDESYNSEECFMGCGDGDLTQDELNQEGNFLRLKCLQGKFYHGVQDDVSNEINTKKEVPLEEVARFLMYPFRNKMSPRLFHSRPMHYIRFYDTVAHPKFSVFGRPLTSYSFCLNDLVFLINLICQRASRLRRQLDMNYLCFLLTRTFHKRNLPLTNQTQNNPFSYAEEFLSTQINHDQSFPGKRYCSHEVHQNGAFHLGVFHTGPPQTMQCRRQIYSALERMDHVEILQYKRKMGPYITDEVFLYLIHLFEILSGTKECVALHVAVAEARRQLGPLSTCRSILRHVYSYWVSRRIALERPLLRELWPTPSANDSNSFTVFRTRAKEKMILRRPRRHHIDFKSRVKEFLTHLDLAQRLFQACFIRDSLKLSLCTTEACLFEQKWKERRNPCYVHPLWSTLCQELKTEEKTFENSIDDTLQASFVNISKNVLAEKDTRRNQEKQTVVSGKNYEAMRMNEEGSSDVCDGGTVKKRRLNEPWISLIHKSTGETCAETVDTNENEPMDYDDETFHFFPPQLLSHDWYKSHNFKQPVSRFTCREKKNESSQVDVPSNTGFSRCFKSSGDTCENPEFASKLGEAHVTKREASKDSCEPCTCEFTSPVPLPPIFLNLPSDCSPLTLETSLKEAGLSSEDIKGPPIGYISCHSLPSNYYNALPSLYVHLKNAQPTITSCDAPCVLRSRNTHSSHGKRQSDLNPKDRNLLHESLLPFSETAKPLTFIPVYRQSLDCLPAVIRHEANRRLVIPYAVKQETNSLLSKEPSSFFLDRPYLDRSKIRLTLRIGRGGYRRPWIDRHRFVSPTLSNLMANPVCLSGDSDNRPFPLVNDSTETFMQCYLETHSRKMKSALQNDTKLDSTTHQFYLKMIREVFDPSGGTRHGPSPKKKESEPLPLYKNVSLYLVSDGNPFLTFYLDILLLKKIDGVFSNVINKDMVTLFCNSLETLSPVVMLPSHGFLLDPSFLSTLNAALLTSHLTTCIAWFSLYSSGFYPAGFGGPECSLSGTRRSDVEPSFVGVLGVDAPSACGGFHMFSITRDRGFLLAKVDKASSELFSTCLLPPHALTPSQS